MRRRVADLVARHRLVIEPALAGAIADELAARAPSHDDAAAARVPGDVYERTLAGSRARRRASGSYYTPPHLVDFVVEQTVGRTVTGLGPDAALNVRVVDPACGGGAFLVAALRRIEAHCVAGGRAGGPELRSEIARRCLVGVDVDAAAVAVCRLALLLAIGARAGDRAAAAAVRRASVEGDALAPSPALARGAFDVCLGNPPWGQKRFRFTAAQREAIARRYRCARGVLDPFKLFVERAHQLVRAGGRWGLVLPDVILLKDQQPIREIVLDGTALEWIVDAGRAFCGVNLDAVVIAGRRVSRPPADARIAVWHELPPTWRRRPPRSRFQRQAMFRRLAGCKFNIHITRADLAVIERLERLDRFGDRFDVHEGVHSGNVRAKLFRRAPQGPGSRKLILGRGEIARYRLSWGGWWIDLSPGLVDRAAGEYANLGRSKWHRRWKIVVRRTGDRIVAALDRHGYYVSNNLFVAIPRGDMGEQEMWAYVALLNAAVSTWYFRTVQPRTGRLFAELKIQHLAALPVPDPARFAAVTPRLAGLAAAMSARAGSDRDRPARGGLPPAQVSIDELAADLFALAARARRRIGASPQPRRRGRAAQGPALE